MSRWVWAGCGLATLVLGSCLLLRQTEVSENQLPSDVWSFLNVAEHVELLSLSPYTELDGALLPPRVGTAAADRHQEQNKDELHGYKVLGRRNVMDRATRTKVVGAICKGVAESDGSVAACFNPRHGLRARSADRTIELVICYECNQIKVYINGQEDSMVRTAKSGQPILDDLLRDAGAPLAP